MAEVNDVFDKITDEKSYFDPSKSKKTNLKEWTPIREGEYLGHISELNTREVSTHKGKHKAIVYNFKVKVDEANIEYYYESGQQCFRTHSVKIDRAPFFTVNQPGKETGRLHRANIDFDEWTDRFNEQSYRSTRR